MPPKAYQRPRFAAANDDTTDTTATMQGEHAELNRQVTQFQTAVGDLFRRQPRPACLIQALDQYGRDLKTVADLTAQSQDRQRAKDLALPTVVAFYESLVRGQLLIGAPTSSAVINQAAHAKLDEAGQMVAQLWETPA